MSGLGLPPVHRKFISICDNIDMRKEKVYLLYKRNSYYHIYNRGNRKMEIFRSRKDYEVFVNMLYRYLQGSSLKLVGYCLMPNHYHMILKNGENKRAVSLFMQRFMTAYVMYFNRKYNLVGRLFQSPFQAKRLPKIRDLENVKEYLRQNPFEAGVTESEVSLGYEWLYIKDEKGVNEGQT